MEDLAAREQGGLDVHDGIPIISMGEKVEEGILVSWYLYSGEPERSISIIYKPPFQEIDLPTLSGGGKEYGARQLPANPYWDQPYVMELPLTD